MGIALPHFRPVYGNSPSVSSKKKQTWAGVISSVEMSSRSLGLFAGFVVSQRRSSPASCRLISSGSSVRKRMRPLSRTLSGRFSILRSRSELIIDPKPNIGAILRHRRQRYHSPHTSIVSLFSACFRVLGGIRQLFQLSPLEDGFELV